MGCFIGYNGRMGSLRKFLLVGLFLLGTSALWACPACKEAVAEASKGGSSGLAQGYQWSIFTMLSVPYLLIAGVAGLLFRSYRKKHK